MSANVPRSALQIPQTEVLIMALCVIARHVCKTRRARQDAESRAFASCSYTREKVCLAFVGPDTNPRPRPPHQPHSYRQTRASHVPSVASEDGVQRGPRRVLCCLRSSSASSACRVSLAAAATETYEDSSCCAYSSEISSTRTRRGRTSKGRRRAR